MRCIPGIDPDAFPALLVGADQVGRDIDAARRRPSRRPIVAAGTLRRAAGATSPSRSRPACCARRRCHARCRRGVVRPTSRPTSTPAWSAATGTVTYAAGDDALVGSEPARALQLEGPLGALSGNFDTEPLAQFLTQRALEREQARVEAMQSALLEKQRLRREVRYYASLQFERDSAAEALRKAEEEARQAAEAEAQGRGGSEGQGRRKQAKAERRRRRKAEEEAQA